MKIKEIKEYINKQGVEEGCVFFYNQGSLIPVKSVANFAGNLIVSNRECLDDVRPENVLGLDLASKKEFFSEWFVTFDWATARTLFEHMDNTMYLLKSDGTKVDLSKYKTFAEVEENEKLHEYKNPLFGIEKKQ